MAAASVIYFGLDNCQRVQALRHVGYRVCESVSLERLRLHLVGKKNVDAVIVSEAEPRRAEQAAQMVREYSSAPLILFRRPDVILDESRFDRVYSRPVPPANWLFDTAVLVMQVRGLRAQARSLRHEAKKAMAESRRLMAPAEA